ncbi:hypothetical protein [Pseudomonas sp. UMAB-40]|uniref:hypothetical protein n=1 Tax=Pseudomonas sp. UMAB-40 TaxID=1365407 RepID=UPI001C57107C|nr:hypothetical protein [Pseudomonas sp. UMAB-40]
MNQYLVEVSAKSKPDGEFRQRMLPTYISEQRLLRIFETHGLVKGAHLQHDGMVAFYSAEGLYPLTRMLVLEKPPLEGSEAWFELLLSSLQTPVTFMPAVQLQHASTSMA